MLRGCLTISEEFALKFISTTKGWNPEELQCKSGKPKGNDSIHQRGKSWLDDRDDPVYVRGDRSYSLSAARRLDDLLRQHCESELANRFKRKL